MKRRTFLGLGLGAGAAALAYSYKMFNANAQNMMGMGHDMSQMSYGEMTGMNMGQNSLLPVDLIPAGAPLANLAILKNNSSEMGFFRAQIEAKPVKIELATGKTTEFWAYNGQVPGPQIVVTEGDSVEINFKNSLTQETTIHWHGLPIPSDQDGNPQDGVKPNQSRIYRFTLPEGSAGTYWYHTHAHGKSAEQAFRGLAGSFIVKAKDDPLSALPERHLLFSDLRLDSNGLIPANDMMDWMNGREGQFVLINGQRQPKITINGTQRLRIWNACNARYLNLNLPNCEFIVVGTDGGLLEKPQAPVTELLVAPAERYEIIVKAKQSGTFPLQSLPYDRKKMMMTYRPETLVLANVTIETSEIEIPSKLRVLPDLGKPTSQKKVIMSENMTVMNNMTSMGDMNYQSMMSNMFLINGRSFDMNRIDLSSRVNEVEEWLIINNSDMDHPFHIHGTQFEVVDRLFNGQITPEPYRARKDVVNLKSQEQVRIRLTQNYTGIRMFHCHILEHEALGMMGILKVI